MPGRVFIRHVVTVNGDKYLPGMRDVSGAASGTKQFQSYKFMSEADMSPAMVAMAEEIGAEWDGLNAPPAPPADLADEAGGGDG